MHRAQADMLMCSKALLNVARTLEERYGIRYFEGSFYGIANTSRAFRQFAALLADPDLAERAEGLIAREEANAWAWIAPLRERLKGKRARVFSGGYKSWSLVSAMQELGLTVVAAGTEKSTEEDKVRIDALMGPDARLIVNNDQTAPLQIFRDYQADIAIRLELWNFPTLRSEPPRPLTGPPLLAQGGEKARWFECSDSTSQIGAPYSGGRRPLYPSRTQGPHPVSRCRSCPRHWLCRLCGRGGTGSTTGSVH